ncbi:MurR/RpiR family transcriptional regulator [Agrobacterium sp. LAD9]|uniref:MurR/RpiR family transcriptional regulator n=1 Tax=Agrobacterium sp. LAD9 TaxID=2055153 RepID=UPI000D1F19BE|nr:MurR/RpiR family transcriptional regulator [Agrobacterium sp. LAD9]
MQETRQTQPLLLDMIYAAINSAPTALARVALYIAQDPEIILSLSVADLARNTGSGPASIVRFCRTLGFSGFRDFKIALSGEIERGRILNLAQRTAPEDIYLPPKLAVLSTALQNSIAASARMLDESQITGLAIRVRAARRIEVFGMGPSSVCADILAMRLIWLGFPVHSPSSASLSHGLARTLDNSSLAIGISSSGVTDETKDFLSIARKTGAHTMAITTRSDCPVAQNAEEVIVVTTAGAWPEAGSAMHVPSIVLLSEYLSLCLQQLESR